MCLQRGPRDDEVCDPSTQCAAGSAPELGLPGDFFAAAEKLSSQFRAALRRLRSGSHLATRRVFVTSGTFQPDEAWMATQASAFLGHAATESMPCAIVIRDRDGKFTAAFDQFFKDRSIQVKPVGPQAPNMNAFVERWIQSLKYEALNHFIVFGQEHFDHIVSEYVAYYHERRPHQGLGNALLPASGSEPCAIDAEASPAKSLALADVKCETRLGGLLKHFYRVAA
jgi:putative transposase